MTNAAPYDDAGQMRLIGAVIALTMLAWLAANWAGRYFGWPSEYAFLADMAALGALVWSLLVTWRVWRRRGAAAQHSRGPAAPQSRASGAQQNGAPGPRQR